MAKYLILDSEALNSLLPSNRSTKKAERARLILEVAHEMRGAVRVPAATLTEVCRSPQEDAALNQLLATIKVLPTSRSIATVAGHLLRMHGMASVHAIDAMVVATAVSLGGGLIATHDPEDLSKLASRHPNVKVFPI